MERVKKAKPRNKRSAISTKASAANEDYYNFTKYFKSENAQETKKINPNRIEYLRYFLAWKTKKNSLNSKNVLLNNINFQLENYGPVIDSIKKEKQYNLYNKTFFKESDKASIDVINRIDKKALFKLMTELIHSNTNIMLYGYGSKIEIIFDFIKYFQEKENTSSKTEVLENNISELNKSIIFEKPYYHIIVINAFNSEVKFSVIYEILLNYLTSYSSEPANNYKKFFSNPKNEEESIQRLALFKSQVLKDFKGKLLLFLNNIDGPSILGKRVQKLLSLLISQLCISVVATCDNAYYPYYWTQEVKDNFSFCFIKYSTFKPYTIEINDKHSITGEKTVKSGSAFKSIYKSLTDKQKGMLKVMAEFQINSDNRIQDLTFNELTNLLIDNMIVAGQGQVKGLLFEPMDHDVIVERVNNKSKKQYYKLNLGSEVLADLADGKYDN